MKSPEAASLFDEDDRDSGSGPAGGDFKLTFHETLCLSSQFSAIWFLANALYNASLARTTVSSTNILSSTSGVFTLIASRFVLDENISIPKAFAVALCFAGIVVVTLTDAKEDSQVWLFLTPNPHPIGLTLVRRSGLATKQR